MKKAAKETLETLREEGKAKENWRKKKNVELKFRVHDVNKSKVRENKKTDCKIKP